VAAEKAFACKMKNMIVDRGKEESPAAVLPDRRERHTIEKEKERRV